MKERFMLKALGLLLMALSAPDVVQWLLALFEGRVGFSTNLLLPLIGAGLFYAHPVWRRAARLYVVLCGLALVTVAVRTFAGFPEVARWLAFIERDTLASIPPPFIALYALATLGLLVGSYVFLHKAALADKQADLSSISD